MKQQPNGFVKKTQPFPFSFFLLPREKCNADVRQFKQDCLCPESVCLSVCLSALFSTLVHREPVTQYRSVVLNGFNKWGSLSTAELLSLDTLPPLCTGKLLLT